MRRFLILFIIALSLFSSCLKDSGLFNYVYTGTVIDEATKLPVEGASVYIGAAMFCETLHEPDIISQIETTKGDGSFKIRVSREDIEDSDEIGCPVIWASKESYKGSVKETIPAASGKDGISIELYHNAHLRLHVKRDAVKDNVDEVEIWISRYDFLNNMKPIEYRFICKGKTYDSILTITNMWSNMSYGFEAGAVGRRQSPMEKRYYSFRKSLTPDSISNIDLSFGFDSSIPTEITQIFNPDLNYGSVSDIDGNVYKTLKIGTQTWMAENLRTTRYNNGDIIPTTTPVNLSIVNVEVPKYQWAYNGDLNNVPLYGRLYTGFVVDDYRNVCPSGWHVPALAEWDNLESFLKTSGNETDGNTIIKSIAAPSGWIPSSVAGSPGNDQVSNNRSGFSALPGGNRSTSGSFSSIYSSAGFWSNWEVNKRPSRVFLSYNSTKIEKRETDFNGSFYSYSIRCLKD